MINYTLDKDKYKAAFLYIAKALGKIEGKKKAYKLFYTVNLPHLPLVKRPRNSYN